jgi:hypothetical protein
MRATSVIALVLLALLLCGAPLSASADTAVPATGVSLSLHAGFSGTAKPGNWIPVIVDVANDARDINGELQVYVEDTSVRTTTFSPSILYTAAATLPSHSRKRIELDLPMPTQASKVQARLVEGQASIAEQEAPVDLVSTNNLLCGALTRDSGSFDSLGIIDIPGRQQHARVVTLDPIDIPSRPQLLASFDCLLIGNVSLTSLTTDQKNSLEAWVGRGGVLVAIGGANWAKSLPFLPSDLLPVDVASSLAIPSLDGLTELGHGAKPPDGPWIVSIPKAIHGTTVAIQDTIPLVNVRRHGEGAVVYLAVDPTTGPLRDWNGTVDLWRYVFSYANAPLLPTTTFGISSTGWGRAPRIALNGIPSLAPPAPLWVAFFLSVYAIVLGPLNYVVLRRWDRREWAWLSIPIIALLATGGAFRLAEDRKSSDVGVNEISIIRSDAGTDTSYVRTYVTLFSPSDSVYDVVTENGALINPLLGGFGFRGIVGSPLPTAGSGGSSTTIGPLKVLQNGPTTLPRFKPGSPDTAGSNALNGFVVDSSIRLSGPLVSALTTDGTFVQGTIKNETGERISDATLILSDVPVQRIGTIPAGATRDVKFPLAGTSTLRRMSLSSLLIPSSGKPSDAQGEAARKDIVDTAFNPFIRSTGISNGGLMLVGWMNRNPLSLTLRDGRPAIHTTTLYASSLRIEPPRGEEVVLPGNAFATHLLASVQPNRQQGGLYDLAPGSALGVQFSAPYTSPISYSKLVLHVEGSIGTGSALPDGVDLGQIAWYDWTHAMWVDQPLSSGDNIVPTPANYISATNQIRVRYTFKPTGSSASTNLSLTRFDVSTTGVAQ